MALISLSFLLIMFFGCQGNPIKGLPRPEVPICLMDKNDPTNFICGTDNPENDFDFKASEIMGTTPKGYLDAENYINKLEDRIRSYQRRCRK